MKTALPCGRRRPTDHLTAGTPQQFGKWQEKLRAYLATNGLKYSEPRWKIAETILASGGHLDAQALVTRVQEKHPGIGSATVYRAVKVLCDAKILKESQIDPQGGVAYELFDDEHHDHIVCLDCGSVFEFHDEKIEERQREVAAKLRFRQEKHRHVIYAHCGYLK